jgi:hypothetical protein
MMGVGGTIMNHQQIRKFLICLSADPGETYASEKWIGTSCPLAPWTHDSGTDANPSFAINCKPGGESIFHCFTCEKGDLLHLIQLLKKWGAAKPKYDLRAALEVLAEEEEDHLVATIKDFDEPPPDLLKTIPWSEVWLDSFMKAVNVPLAMEYLHDRSVSKEVAEHLDIRWDGNKEAVCFPVRDWDDRFVGLRGRRLDGGYHDYGGPENHRNKLVWYGESRVDLSRPVLLVESVFDYASACRVCGNILAPMTVGMGKPKVKRIEAALDIVTLFDTGKGGDKAAALIDKYLSTSNRYHCKPPKGRKDPGDMTVEELRNVLSGKIKIT